MKLWGKTILERTKKMSNKKALTRRTVSSFRLKAFCLTLALLLTSLCPLSVSAETVGDMDLDFVEADSLERNLPERPADAEVIEIIELEIDEDGNITETPPFMSRSYYSPAAITLSPSGSWYRGSWRTFDGNYIGYDVTATYSNGATSSYHGLYIFLESWTPYGDNNRNNWAVRLDGRNVKGDDWRKIQGGSRDYRFAYYNSTYGTSYSGNISVKVTVYSWN